MIRLDNISKQHGHQSLYIDASMGLLKGEKAGLVGPDLKFKSSDLSRLLLVCGEAVEAFEKSVCGPDVHC